MPTTDAGDLFIGLMSGTSVDGIDAALVRFDPVLQIVAAHTFAMPDQLTTKILRLSQAKATIDLDELGSFDTRLGHAFADAVNALLASTNIDRQRVRAIGSHGQTLRHQPSGNAPFTLQLGDGHVIAEQTGITTVSDFRRRDVAAGGQGAPLVPAFHAAMLAHPDEQRAVLNIGGIANVTLLDATGIVRGFDTGPGNALMDAWCLKHQGERFDRGGAFASLGQTNSTLLTRLLEDPWLALPPPKSTGRDHYHLTWLEQRLTGLILSPADVQATLCLFTATTITNALQAQLPKCRRVLVCGGGVHNLVLMSALSANIPGIAFQSTAEFGLDPDFVEAIAFAWLARETLAGRPGNLPAVTGARGPRVLGVIHPATN